jgi:hypothetical protein
MPGFYFRNTSILEPVFRLKRNMVADVLCERQRKPKNFESAIRFHATRDHIDILPAVVYERDLGRADLVLGEGISGKSQIAMRSTSSSEISSCLRS